MEVEVEEIKSWKEFKRLVKTGKLVEAEVDLAEDVPEMDLRDLLKFIKELIHDWILEQFGVGVAVGYRRVDLDLPEFLICDNEDCIFVIIDIQDVYEMGVVRVLGFMPASASYERYYFPW